MVRFGELDADRRCDCSVSAGRTGGHAPCPDTAFGSAPKSQVRQALRRLSVIRMVAARDSLRRRGRVGRSRHFLVKHAGRTTAAQRYVGGQRTMGSSLVISPARNGNGMSALPVTAVYGVKPGIAALLDPPAHDGATVVPLFEGHVQPGDEPMVHRRALSERLSSAGRSDLPAPKGDLPRH